MKGSEIAIGLLVLAAIAAVVAWWFFIRPKDENITSVKDVSFMIGKIYGSSNLTSVYEFLDSTTVKLVQDTSPCSYVTWELKTPTTLEISGKGAFTIQTDSLKSADGEIYTKLTGDVSSYCDLIGKNV